ncbi:MAG: hypothetical protein K8I60_12510 [Anaerolineae bacterium]|nr:hypothetical protein [Anaerolineae bacterium]
MLTTIIRQAGFIGHLRYFFWVRHYTRVVQMVMVTLTILLTFVATVLMEKNILLGMLVIVGFVGLWVAILMYYRMEVATLLVVVVSIVLKDGISTGTETKITFTFLLLVLLTVLWVFRMIFVDRSFKLRSSPANFPAVLFIITVVVSFIWSDMFVDYAVKYRYEETFKPRIMSTVAFILSPSAYLLYANHIKSNKAVRFFVGFFIVLGGVIIIMRLTHTRPPFFNDDGQMPVWAVALATGQLLFNRKLKWWVLVGLSLVAGLWSYNQFGLGITWLSGWLPLGLCFGIFLFLRSWKFFLIFVLLAGVVLALNAESVLQTLNAENDESGHTRTDAWKQIMGLTDDHILFGVGPTGYAPYLWTYVGDFMATHNNYFDMIAQLGIVGFTLFVWFWFSILWLAWRTYLMVPREGFYYGLSVSLVATSAATIVIAALGDWIIPFAYTQGIAGIDYTIWPWLLAGMVVANHHQVRAIVEGKQAMTALVANPVAHKTVPVRVNG